MSDKHHRILTISDRYEEGGAAEIARKTHLYIENKTELKAKFIYGWSKKGFPNSSFPKEVICTSRFLGPHINAMLFPFMGKNVISSKAEIEKLILEADLVHIHNIHTYGFDYMQIIKIINKYKKPVVITAHDDWYYTGRCAIKQTCNLWREGCPKCPHLDNYHKVFIDRAKEEFKVKTKAFNSLENVTFTAPSDFVVENLKVTYPSKKVLKIRNGIDTSPFHFKKKGVDDNNEKPLKCLIIDNNFNNSVKLDYAFLEYIIQHKVELNLVGRGTKYAGENITNHGYVSSREKLNEIMQDSDILLFFSQVDSFGLVLAEALSAGLYICAYDSLAVHEVTKNFDRTIISKNPKDFMALLESEEFIKKVRSEEKRMSRSLQAKSEFDETGMIKNFVDLYSEML